MISDLQRVELLKLAWAHRLFSTESLLLADGRPVELLETGHPTERGDDFSGAVFRLPDEEVTLYGTVRIDARSSHWRESGRMSEPASDSIMLHVVGERDRVLIRGGQPVRTLVLPLLPSLEEAYNRLLTLGNRDCIPFFGTLESIRREHILSRLMADRLRRKVAEVQEIYHGSGEDWDETAYICFLRSLGMGEKKRSYEALARSLPYRYILKAAGDTQQIEALLMGQSGYLSLVGDAPDAYTRQLQDIYLGLKQEYGLRRPVVLRGVK